MLVKLVYGHIHVVYDELYEIRATADFVDSLYISKQLITMNKTLRHIVIPRRMLHKLRTIVML